MEIHDTCLPSVELRSGLGTRQETSQPHMIAINGWYRATTAFLRCATPRRRNRTGPCPPNAERGYCPFAPGAPLHRHVSLSETVGQRRLQPTTRVDPGEFCPRGHTFEDPRGRTCATLSSARRDVRQWGLSSQLVRSTGHIGCGDHPIFLALGRKPRVFPLLGPLEPLEMRKLETLY